MARTRQSKTQDQVEVNKAINPTDTPERFRLGEMGHIGIPIFNGVSTSELKSDLNHPQSVNTYKLMSMHPAVNSCLSLFTNMVGNLRYRVVPPNDATEEEKNQAKIIESMLDDMEHSFEDFILEAMTCTTYGWAVNEKVFRKRTYASGSKYNDGLIGIKKLPLRAQESIPRFVFDDSGNNVIAVKQSLAGVNDTLNRWVNRNSTEVTIPRSKFMLFTLGKNRSNPYGTSPLREVYTAWRYLQALEEMEALSVTKDINGIPVLSLPAQYLSADADPSQKAILENFKNMLRNLQQGSQSAIILPSAVDEATRSKLFEIELLSADGKKQFSIDDIKKYYREMIFIGLGADILLMGVASSSSFALGSIKSSMTASTAEVFIKRILDVVNRDLIKQIYSLNNWRIDRCCKIDYEEMGEESIDEIGKYIQRTSSVGMLTRDLDTVNRVRTAIGLDALSEDTNIDDILPENKSRASDGMKTAGDGTSNSVSASDNSANNLDNAA